MRLPITPGPVALEYLGAEADPIHSADEWELLYPPGKGFIKMDGSYYLVSMYHQMHCINAFRRSILEQYQLSGLSNITESRIMHLTHCLSYLRQSILCNSDISLELTAIRQTVNGETVHAAYGGGVTHECRDWSEIHNWAAKNHLEWEKDDDFEVI